VKTVDKPKSERKDNEESFKEERKEEGAGLPDTFAVVPFICFR